MPQERQMHALCLYNEQLNLKGYIIASGGVTGQRTKEYTAGDVSGGSIRTQGFLSIYEVETDSWLPGPLPEPNEISRYNHGSACAGSMVYVFCGSLTTEFRTERTTNTIEGFDLSRKETAQWVNISVSFDFKVRAGPIVFPLPNKRNIVIFGGENNGTQLKDGVYTLDCYSQELSQRQLGYEGFGDSQFQMT